MAVNYVGPGFSPLPDTAIASGIMVLGCTVPFGATPVRQERRFYMRGWSASLGSFRTWQAGSVDIGAAEYTGDGKPLTDVVCVAFT